MPSKTIRTDFDTVKKRIVEYRQEVDAIFAEYRAKVNREEKRLLPETLKEEKKKWAKDAREKIASAYSMLDTFYNTIDRPVFIDELTGYTTAPGDSKFLEALRAYREFGIPMTRIELDALSARPSKRPASI